MKSWGEKEERKKNNEQTWDDVEIQSVNFSTTELSIF